VSTTAENSHIDIRVARRTVTALRFLQDGIALIPTVLKPSNDVKEPERAHTSNKFLRQTTKKVGLFTELPLDVLNCRLGFNLGQLVIGRAGWNDSGDKSALDQNLDETLRGLCVTVVLGGINRKLDPFGERFALVLAAKAVLLANPGMEPNGVVDGLL
jgi:hypothetical protein